MEQDSFVLGVGNAMMTDDGVGPAVVQFLSENETDHKFGLVDVGGDGMKVLHYLESAAERFLLVDSAYMGLNPGEYKIFRPEDVASTKEVDNFSTHSGDVLQIIAMGRRLGYTVPRVKIMGVEPESMAEGIQLTATLREKLPLYAKAIEEEMAKDW